MTRKLIWRLCVLGCAIGISACAPKTRFEWGTYEASLYTYYKNPSERVQYETALVKAIETGKKTNKVAPGLYAELGYLYLEDGNIARAQVNFDEEMKLFPESRQFLSGISRRVTPGGGTAPANGATKGPTS